MAGRSSRNNRQLLWLFAGASLALALVPWLPAGMIDHTRSLCLWTNLGLGPCPGCGMTRALWHLLHGQLAAAWHFNHLIVIAAPALAGLYLKLGFLALAGRRLETAIPR